MMKTLRSINLHLEHPPGKVVEVNKLVDIGCGMYPCYYTKTDDSVLVSTSVTELISFLGGLKENSNFDPPEFMETTLLDRVNSRIPSKYREHIPDFVGPTLRKIGFLSSTHWYESLETIDDRISVLQPFEIVTSSSSEQKFNPTYSIRDKQRFVEESVKHMTDFVNKIERRYPDYHHVIRMGGKDSQLISLVPKVSDNWHVFSADPNYPIIKEFLEKNSIEFGQLFHHDNQNRESRSEFEKKIICSDLRGDPHHLRWLPQLTEIATYFDNKCIFWSGTEGDTLNSYHSAYHGVDDYFDVHFTRAANWQSITHQVTKNYTGCAALSPYHSNQIWEDLYRHYDPEMISKSTDLRPAIGEALFRDDVWWPDRNPGPAPYSYRFSVDLEEMYRSYLNQYLSGERNSVIRSKR